MKTIFRGSEAAETPEAARVADLRRSLDSLQSEIESIDRELATLNAQFQSARFLRGHHAAAGYDDLATADSAEISEIRRQITEATASRQRLRQELLEAQADLSRAEWSAYEARKQAALPELRTLAADLLAAFEKAAAAAEKFQAARGEFQLTGGDEIPAVPLNCRPAELESWLGRFRKFTKGR